MPYISWIDESAATGAVAEAYAHYFRWRPERTRVADVIKCFSHRPDFLVQALDFSRGLHFQDGHLTVRVKEMIATVVSGQNRCPYCLHSHAYMLHRQGGSDDVISLLARGEVESAPVTTAERALLQYAKRLTNESHRTTAADAQELRDVGWTEPQIAEAVYITAMFAFFNRIANAFGLEDPQMFANAGLADPVTNL